MGDFEVDDQTHQTRGKGTMKNTTMKQPMTRPAPAHPPLRRGFPIWKESNNVAPTSSQATKRVPEGQFS